MMRARDRRPPIGWNETRRGSQAIAVHVREAGSWRGRGVGRVSVSSRQQSCG